jgi:hypothetical protein
MLFKKSKSVPNPFELDWGEITPDIYEKDKNEITNVAAHFISNEDGQRFSPIYVAGRVLWYNEHLPTELKQRVLLDIRGQDEIKYNTEIKANWGKATRSRVEAKKENLEFVINLLF